MATGAAASDASNSTSGLTGGSKCVGSYMCISGIVNGSTVQCECRYAPESEQSLQCLTHGNADTMQSTGKADLGWMAL